MTPVLSWTCPYCGRFFLYHIYSDGDPLRFPCPRCRTITILANPKYHRYPWPLTDRFTAALAGTPDPLPNGDA